MLFVKINNMYTRIISELLTFTRWKSCLATFACLFFVFIAMVSCSKVNDHHAAALEEVTYTCSMHPSVIKHAPGKCPICGMDLVLKKKLQGDSDDLMLSGSQIKLANIATKKVTIMPMGQTVVLNAALVLNQQGSGVVSSRAAGRVERLFVKETGRIVKKGQALYTLYSETLLTLQREYLLAKEQYELLGDNEPRYASFLNAAEQKLLLYGLSPKQVDKLKESKMVQESVTFLSPADGIITAISVEEGQYISEGAVLYTVEDISSLWVEAEMFPREVAFVKVGDVLTIRINGFDALPIEAKVDFLSPEYRANSQIIIMRATLDNARMLYQPGMQAQVFLTHSSRNTVVVPADAVIRDGFGTHVYVQTDSNTFQPKMVKTGLEDFEQVEVTEGLKENDIVVIRGAYLLYSELILRKGSDPMASHHH